MKKVFIVHGLEGSPNGGWRPWLMGKLEDKGIYACALSMPDPEDPKCEEWVEEIARHVEKNKNDEIILVGHSLGVPAILRFLETSEISILGAVLVSGPASVTDNEKANRFFTKSFDFEKIKARTKKFAIIHGENDSLVPLSEAKILQEKFGCVLNVIPNGGHLNGSSGWRELPACLDALLRM